MHVFGLSIDQLAAAIIDMNVSLERLDLRAGVVLDSDADGGFVVVVTVDFCRIDGELFELGDLDLESDLELVEALLDRARFGKKRIGR